MNVKVLARVLGGSIIASSVLITTYDEGYRLGKSHVTPLSLLPPSAYSTTLRIANSVNPERPDDLNGDGIDDLIILRDDRILPLYGITEKNGKKSYASKEDMRAYDRTTDYDAIDEALNRVVATTPHR